MRGGTGVQQVAALQKATSLIPRSLLSSSPVLSKPSRAMSTVTNDASPAVPISDQKRSLRSKLCRDLRAFPPSQRAQEDITIQNIVLDSSWFKSSSRLCAYISCEALREVDTSKILSEVLKEQFSDCHMQVKKKLYVPRVEDKNSHMRMLNISSVKDLVANYMNILEPSPADANGNPLEDVMLANDPVDIILLPGLAFDREGRRLGRGGGRAGLAHWWSLSIVRWWLRVRINLSAKQEEGCLEIPFPRTPQRGSFGTGYYDLFLKKYQELAVKRKWKQPLLIALAYSLQIMDEGVVPVTPTDVLIDALVSPSGVIPISPAATEKM